MSATAWNQLPQPVKVGPTETKAVPKRPRKERKSDPSKAGGPTNVQKFEELYNQMKLMHQGMQHMHEKMVSLENEVSTLKAIVVLSGMKPVFEPRTVPSDQLGKGYSEMTQMFQSCMK